MGKEWGRSKQDKSCRQTVIEPRQLLEKHSENKLESVIEDAYCQLMMGVKDKWHTSGYTPARPRASLSGVTTSNMSMLLAVGDVALPPVVVKLYWCPLRAGFNGDF
jgi:hypothetical protein